MHLYQRLQTETAADRDLLLSAPSIQRALRGEVTRELYIEFLTQAYHHVRHTVPLMMAVGARLPERHEWVREPVLHYLDEEAGHEQWILNDIANAGGDRAAAEGSQPAVATEAMVAYAYDTVMRRNPLGFFGMVYVLEGHERRAGAPCRGPDPGGARAARRTRSATCAATASSTGSTSATSKESWAASRTRTIARR